MPKKKKKLIAPCGGLGPFVEYFLIPFFIWILRCPIPPPSIRPSTVDEECGSVGGVGGVWEECICLWCASPKPYNNLHRPSPYWALLQPEHAWLVRGQNWLSGTICWLAVGYLFPPFLILPLAVILLVLFWRYPSSQPTPSSKHLFLFVSGKGGESRNRGGRGPRFQPQNCFCSDLVGK